MNYPAGIVPDPSAADEQVKAKMLIMSSDLLSAKKLN